MMIPRRMQALLVGLVVGTALVLPSVVSTPPSRTSLLYLREQSKDNATMDQLFSFVSGPGRPAFTAVAIEYGFIGPNGSLGLYTTAPGAASVATFAKRFRDFQTHCFIVGTGPRSGMPGIERVRQLLRNPDKFIATAVKGCSSLGFSGMVLDIEPTGCNHTKGAAPCTQAQMHTHECTPMSTRACTYRNDAKNT